MRCISGPVFPNQGGHRTRILTGLLFGVCSCPHCRKKQLGHSSAEGVYHLGCYPVATGKRVVFAVGTRMNANEEARFLISIRGLQDNKSHFDLSHL